MAGSDVMIEGTTKLGWDELATDLQERIERELGAPVVASETQSGGFTWGTAVRLRLGNGDRAFVKATSSERSEAIGMYRHEARVVASLGHVPQVPRLRTAFEYGPWFVLVFDDVEGRRPELPWDRGEFDRVVTELRSMFALLDPSPLEDLPRGIDELRAAFGGWAGLGDDPARLAGLDPWIADHLDELHDLALPVSDVWDGDALSHFDIRDDLVVVGNESVWVVDWAQAMLGNQELDLFAMLPSSAMQGGQDLAELLHWSGVHEHVDQAELVRLGSGLAALFLEAGTRPALPDVPTLREFQLGQGRVLVDWIRRQW